MISYFYGKFVYPSGHIEGTKSSFVKYMDDKFYYGYDVLEGKIWSWMRPIDNEKIYHNQKVVFDEFGKPKLVIKTESKK